MLRTFSVESISPLNGRGGVMVSKLVVGVVMARASVKHNI